MSRLYEKTNEVESAPFVSIPKSTPPLEVDPVLLKPIHPKCKDCEERKADCYRRTDPLELEFFGRVKNVTLCNECYADRQKEAYR